MQIYTSSVLKSYWNRRFLASSASGGVRTGEVALI